MKRRWIALFGAACLFTATHAQAAAEQSTVGPYETVSFDWESPVVGLLGLAAEAPATDAPAPPAEKQEN